jgi:transposase, IS5 family
MNTMMLQSGFFDLQERYRKLSELGDPLEAIEAVVDWEGFRTTLAKVHAKDRKSNAGRRPFDSLLMFKVLVLQSLYNLGDDQTEFQIRDRFSFLRFLRLTPEGKIPDAKTIWLFREALKEKGLIEKLFARFDAALTERGYAAQKGMVIDARIVEAPKQRNSREENELIKQGLMPADWQKVPAKCRQKDLDARWTKKHGRSYYGYKNHVNVDARHKLIRRYQVSSAEVHDSQKLEALLDPRNTRQSAWADSAYRSRDSNALLKKRSIQNCIHYRAWQDGVLAPWQKETNRRRSKIRARVEHVFGHQVKSMKMTVVRGIGLARASFKIGLANLVYNMSRLAQLERCTT